LTFLSAFYRKNEKKREKNGVILRGPFFHSTFAEIKILTTMNLDFSDLDTTDEPIIFNVEDIDFELPNTEAVIAWIHRVAESEDKRIGAVSYIFCSDNYLIELNREYLKHDTLTDIITFPYAKAPIEGDIFISLDRVQDNAKDFGVAFEQELRRVIIHGVLHLCGYGDKTKAQAAVMRQKEDAALAIYASV
jgi:probable rRNA maturation factor